MILRMNSIILLLRLACDSWIPCLRKSGSEIRWYLVFELGLSVGMVMRANVGSPLGYSINMLLGLALGNLFGTWEGYLVGVSLDTLAGLIIWPGEGYLMGLSLGLLLGYPIESPNS